MAFGISQLENRNWTFKKNVTIQGDFTFGNASSDTFTMYSNSKLLFRDSGLYLYSSADGQLDMIADTKAMITAPTIELEGSTGLTLDGDVTIDGAHTFATGTGAVSVNGDTTLAAAKKHYIRDTGLYIYSSTDGQMDLIGDTKIQVTAPTIALTGSSSIKLDGTVTFDDDGTLADASNVMTITQNTITLAGATKINLDGPVDVTGALVLDGAATTGITLNAAMTNGISITPTAATTCAILIGTSISAGMPMSGTKNGLIRAFGEIQADEALSNDIRGIWGRVRQNTTVALTGGYQVNAVQGSVKMYGGSGTTTTLWNHSGLYGSFETDGVASSSVASTGHVSAVTAMFSAQANFTIDSGAYAAALMVLNGTASITATGSFAGVHVKKATGLGTTVFTDGVKVDADVATTCFTTSGTSASATGRVLKGAMTVNNGNYGDGYGLVESELTLTGTVAGAVSALSSWINMASVTTGGNHVCAQTNGLWSDTGGVLTNGVFIFGMRAQCLLQTNGGASGATFYPFSIVNNTNVTTALIKCNAGSSDLGTTAVSKSSESKYVPLYTDDAGTHYVLIYN